MYGHFQVFVPIGAHPLSEFFIEEIDGTVPGEFGGFFVITGGSIIVEPVVDLRIYMGRICLLVGFQSCFKGRPSLVDSLVQPGILQQ